MSTTHTFLHVCPVYVSMQPLPTTIGRPDTLNVLKQIAVFGDLQTSVQFSVLHASPTW